MKLEQHLRRVAIWLAATLLLPVGTAAGAGFAIMEQSVRGLGTAFSGEAASAEDASTIFFNPAGLTRLGLREAMIGMSMVSTNGHFHNTGSTDLTGAPLSGDEGGNAGAWSLTPSAYYAHRLNDRLHLGLGIFSPFGLSTGYDPSWAGRYHAITSKLTTLTVNPSLAYRITDNLSLGAGVAVQYLTAKLTNAIDFGTIFSVLGAPGMAPQKNDGFVTLEGDSWSWGFNCGALYEFDDATRIGIAYRSAITHTLKGDATFSGVPAANPTNRFRDTGIRADVKLPDSLSVSILHNFSTELAATADVTWTNWSTLKELRIRFDNAAESDAVTTTDWRDSFRYSIGGVYHPGAWAFRLGMAYDQTPVPDAAHRTPRVPDSDRTWIATGIGYSIGSRSKVDIGYAHVFLQNARIEKTATGEDRFRGALQGSYRTSGDIFGIEATWEF